MNAKNCKNEVDCWDVEEIICPYCYEQVEQAEEWVADKNKKVKISCPYCSKTFLCEPEHIVFYTTTRIGENGEEIVQWDDEELEELGEEENEKDI